MHTQLQHATQAAALAGVARLASSDSLDTATTQNAAITSAQNLFRRNSINQFSLGGATIATNASHTPGANEGSIFVEFLNPNNNNQPVTIGQADGRIVHTVGAFGLVPVFSRYFSMGLSGPYTIRAQGFGEVPDIDIAMAFDTSASIDDQTPISLVHCYWDKNSNRVRARISKNGDGAGRLFDVFQAPGDGHAQNAEYIQGIYANPQNGYDFLSYIRNASSNNGPPGNHNSVSSYYYNNYNPNAGSAQDDYTHCLVNINVDGDWKPVYPMTFGSIRCDNLYEHLALATGWLDSWSAYNQSRISTCPEVDLTPITNARQTYLTAIRSHIQPIGSAQEAAQNFFTILHNNTNSHFAFTSFNDDAATSPTSTKRSYTVGPQYTVAGQSTYPDPGIPMDEDDDKFEEIYDAIPTTIAYGGTNIADGINRCRQWINNGGRPGADGVCIVFTDGRPTAGGGLGGALSAAQQCKNDGITIHSIGLAQNSVVVPGEVEALNDGAGKTVTYTDEDGNSQSYTPSGDGIAAKGAGKGSFYLVSNQQSLRYAFENLARRLVQIVKVK